MALYSVVLKKNAELKPLKAKKIDGSDLSMHFAYIRQILKDLPAKLGGKAAVESDDDQTKTNAAVIAAVSESVRVLEATLNDITSKIDGMNKTINTIADAVREAGELSAQRNTDLAVTVEHLGKTVAENAILTQSVARKVATEAEHAAARARVLQETAFATAILNRQELCSTEVQTIKQLRVCLECLFTPVELLLKSNDPEFEPRTIDAKRWKEISDLQTRLDQKAEREAAGESVEEEEPEVDLALVGVEALLVDEDGVVGTCAGQCTEECRHNAAMLLQDDATQAVRAQVPGTLVACRFEADLGRDAETPKGEEFA